MLTKSNLALGIQNSENLNSIFNSQDPNFIAETIQIELNTLIDTIAPCKIVQNKKDYCPYYDNEILNDIQNNKNMLKLAIETNDKDNWRNFKNNTINLNTKIEEAKKEYFKKGFSSKNDQWKFLKKFNENLGQQIPNNINFEGEQITSSKKIADIANHYFKLKIETIRKTFTPTNINPIDILSHLIPRNENLFVIPPIQVSEVRLLISSLTNSNSVGFDSLSNKI